MTGDKTEDPPQPEPHVRWRRAAEALATTRSDLPAQLAESVGLPAPSGPLADDLITQTLDTLDALVPIGVVKTESDLVDATKDLGFETIPPIPSQIASAQVQIKDTIARLVPTELHYAATQLGLKPDTMQWGVRVALLRERHRIGQQASELLASVEFDEVGYPDVDPDVQAAEHAYFRSTVDAAVHSLRTQRPNEWDPTHVECLRFAVALHLAQLGDAFLLNSEPAERGRR